MMEMSMLIVLFAGHFADARIDGGWDTISSNGSRTQKLLLIRTMQLQKSLRGFPLY